MNNQMKQHEITMPHNTELEKAVLGAILIESSAIVEVIDELDKDSFYAFEHQAIYEACFQLHSEGTTVDPVLVSQELRKKKKLEAAGGMGYLGLLMNDINSSLNIVKHAKSLKEYQIRRKLIRVGYQMLKAAQDETHDVLELLNDSQFQLQDTVNRNCGQPIKSLADLQEEVLQELDEYQNNPHGMSGLPSGLHLLDMATSGWQKGDLILLAARPAMGKTSLMCSIARNVTGDLQQPVGVFSLEMQSKKLYHRLACAEAGYSFSDVTGKRLQPYEWDRLKGCVRQLAAYPMHIDDTGAISFQELRAKAIRLKERHEIKLLMIDYIQLITTKGKKFGTREQEVAHISGQLKKLAKELDMPIIALSQLSRAVEARDKKRPRLSDLRESGSLEQDADLVMFLYRPEYYGIKEDASGASTKDVAEVIIAKHRNGTPDDIPLKFNGHLTRFENWPQDDFTTDVEVST